MAKKKETKAAVTKEKVDSKAKTSKKESSEDEKAAKKKARMEAIKNRPAGQRPNSKQVDVIEFENGSVLKSFGYSIKKTGTLVTSALFDKDGNPVSCSTTFIPGTKVKSKKDHGTINPGVSGEGKKKKSEDTEEED